MDIQTLIEKNATVLQAHDERVAAAELAERERLAREKASEALAKKKLWMLLGVDEIEISDDGVLCVGEWAVKAVLYRIGYSAQSRVYVEITPVDKESVVWQALEAAEDEDFTPRVMMSWFEIYSPALLGKVAAFIRDTLPKMPDIMRDKLAKVQKMLANEKFNEPVIHKDTPEVIRHILIAENYVQQGDLRAALVSLLEAVTLFYGAEAVNIWNTIGQNGGAE